MAELILKAGREKPLLNRHPWIFSGAIGSLSGSPSSGETVSVHDSRGNFLAWSGYSPISQIRARVWSWNPDEVIDVAFFHRQIDAALNLRQNFISGDTNSYRLVHGESDGIPGLIVDRYGEILVVQFLFAGNEPWRNSILERLQEIPGITVGYERSDSRVRTLEGLDPRNGLLFGSLSEDDAISIENGARYKVDFMQGQKTGFYLDQRDTRQVVRALAHDRDVLDGYCYTGSMSINAHLGGAKTVTAVDSSENSLELGQENLALNEIDPDVVDWIQGDVPSVLRKFRDQAKRFGMIILDPPNFAPTRGHADKAARAYKDINLLAFKLLEPGGTLVTCSCSGGVSPELFQKIVASAAVDAKVDAQILLWLHQGEDHPVRLSFPEGAYLKGLVCRRE